MANKTQHLLSLCHFFLTVTQKKYVCHATLQVSQLHGDAGTLSS